MGLFSNLYTDKPNEVALDRTPTNDLAADATLGRPETRLEPANSTATDLKGELAKICLDLSVTGAEVFSELSEDDLDDWSQGKTSIDTLRAFAQSLVNHRMIERGRTPPHFTKRATCACCGPIWYWLEVTVDGCPWCRIRRAGRAIPRPPVHNG